MKATGRRRFDYNATGYAGVLIEKPRKVKELWRCNHEHKTRLQAIKCAEKKLLSEQPKEQR